MFWLNIGVLGLLLAGILLFRHVIADRTAGIIDQLAPPAAGTGSGSAAHTVDEAEQVARNLVLRAVARANMTAWPP